MNRGKTDLELIKGFIGGDESAFNELTSRYQEKIYWHARRMTGNHFDADDVMQEVLMVLYNKLKDFRFESSFYTWLYRITATRSINYLRKKKIRRLFSLNDEENPIDLQDPVDLVEDISTRETVVKIESMLGRLPAKQREVFILRNYEQLSYDEISRITGKSVGALKANYFHAVEKMQKYLNDHE